MHTDIMFVNTHAFLITVAEPLGLTLCTDLGRKASGRSLSVVRAALTSKIAILASQNFIVTTLLTDGEGAIASMSAELQGRGISVNPAGPGQHIPRVERKIREIKERIRGIIATTPWSIPRRLLPHLVQFAVSRINLVPHRGGILGVACPREAFLGIKTDYSIDLQVGFGDSVEATRASTDNSTVARTHAAISLSPAGYDGTCWFFDLQTKTTFKAAKYTLLPTTDAVISVMNALAAADDKAVSIPALEFARGGQLLLDTPPAGVVAPPVDEDEDQPPALIEDYDYDSDDDADAPKVVDADNVFPLEDEVVIERRADAPAQDATADDDEFPELLEDASDDEADVLPPQKPSYRG